MTYKQRYRPPKFGDNAGASAIVDTGDPYQNLANAIVEQAAEDYRAAAKWLAKHPDPPKLRDFITEEQIRALRLPKQRTKLERLLLKKARPEYKDEVFWEVETAMRWRIEQGSRVRRSKAYRAYQLAEERWSTMLKHLRDCEAFFCGDWIHVLTKADGVAILKKLQEEECHGSKDVSALRPESGGASPDT